MSRATRSASRSPSHSRSRSRSRSRSHSRSRSTSQSGRSHSRSRTRKHRYSSRSRSRSRSHSRSQSPLYNRDKKYFKGYPNNREFRGYHRGFRRPYNFRGRGRGYFPRGRYQRGGGGGGRGYHNNNNYSNNFRGNWKNYKQSPQKQQKQHNHQSQSRGRPHLQKFSGSPSPGHSRQSDRSVSPSRQSLHSNASSHSSSPKSRPALLPANQNCNNVKDELLAPKEVQKEGPDRDQFEVGDAKKGQSSEKREMDWQGLMNCNSSPKRASPANPAVVALNQKNTEQDYKSPQNINDTSNGSPCWQTMCNPSSNKRNLSQEALNEMLSSLDIFNSEEYPDGDKTAITIAFREFLKEHNKKSKSTLGNNRRTEADTIDTDKVDINDQAPAGITGPVSKRHKEHTDEVPLNHLLKASPCPSDEEDKEVVIPRPHSRSVQKDKHNGDASCNLKSKVSQPAQELFNECFDKRHSELNTMRKEMYTTHKSAAITAAIARREMVGDFEELGCKTRKRSKSPSIPSPSPTPLRQMLMVMGEDMSLLSTRKPETKINVRMDFLGDSLIGTSEILAKERQLSQDLVQSSKRGQEFHSIFQHVQAAPLQKTPSELFAQHIVAILHHIRAQHFASSRMTLNERFTVYQRQAAQKETMKARQSPEIHRRIDVSPSAFKKHSQVFEEMKSSEDGTYKNEKMKADPMDLRLDIERRKKYSSRETDYSHNQDVGVSPDSHNNSERSAEKLSYSHKKPKISDTKGSRSRSSSSSSSSKSQMDEFPKSELKDESFNRVRLDPNESLGPAEKETPWRGFQVRFHGRGRKKGNHPGDGLHGSQDMAVQPKHEDWDPEYPPKSRTYYLHDDRDSEADSKWTEKRGRGRGSFTRGRARFIIRKTNANPNVQCSKHERFNQDNGEENSGEQEYGMDRDHEDGNA